MTTTPDLLSPLLEALDFDALAPEEQEEMLVDIQDLIYRGSLVRLVEKMDEGTREDFDALIARDASDEEVSKFIQDRIPNADSAVLETVEELRNDIAIVTA